MALIAVLGVLFSITGSAQQAADPGVLLRSAIEKEEVDGDLKGAIALYRQIIEKHGNNAAVAARAQLHIGMCYEKLGLREAQNAYQSVIDSYPQQTEAVKLARRRLANLLKAQVVIEGRDEKLTIRKIWETQFNDPLGPPSPDGRYLPCYDENGNVTLTDLTTGEIRPVTTGASWNNPFADGAVISPDGKRIAIAWFNTDNFDELRLANIDGSGNRLLYRSPSRKGLIPSDWSADGKSILAFSYYYGKPNAFKETEIVVVSAENGQFTTVKTIPGLRTIRFSPDGRFVVFDALENENWDISILPLDGGNRIQLVSHPAHDQLLGWTPDGKNILFTSDRKGTWGIWMVAVKDGQAQGDPQLVKADIGKISPLGFTRSGSFYFSRGGFEFDVHEANIDLINNKLLGPPKPAVYEHIGQNMTPAWSDDGRYLAYVARPGDIREKRALFIRDEISGKTRSLVPPNLPDFAYPFWSPDGSRIAVHGRDQDHGQGYYSIDIQSGAVTPIVIYAEAKEFDQLIQWGSGSKTVFGVYKNPDGMFEIRERQVDTGKENVVYRAAQKDVRGDLFALSSDRTRIAYKKWQAGEKVERLTISTLNGKDSKELWTAQPPYSITHIVWTPDSRRLLFSQKNSEGKQTENELWVVGVDDGEAKKIGVLSRLGVGWSDHPKWSVHPNGRKIAFSVADKKTEVWALENFIK
jgi:Tol biopolymer transport system component